MSSSTFREFCPPYSMALSMHTSSPGSSHRYDPMFLIGNVSFSKVISVKVEKDNLLSSGISEGSIECEGALFLLHRQVPSLLVVQGQVTKNPLCVRDFNESCDELFCPIFLAFYTFCRTPKKQLLHPLEMSAVIFFPSFHLAYDANQ